MLCRSNTKLWDEQSQSCLECQEISLPTLIKYARFLGIFDSNDRNELCEKISTYISVNFPSDDNKLVNIDEIVEFGKNLGEGNFGVVKEAVLLTNQYSHLGFKKGDVIAVKIMDDPQVTYKTLKEFENVRKLSQACANYVTSYLDVLYDEKGKKLYFLMEHVNGISLDMFLFLFKRDRDIQVTEKLIWPLVKQMLLGLSCIHQMGVAHGDVHGGNIMLSNCEKLTPNCKVKFIDFGLSCFKEDCLNHLFVDPWFAQAYDVYYLVEYIVKLFNVAQEKSSTGFPNTSKILNILSTKDFDMSNFETTKESYHQLFQNWQNLQEKINEIDVYFNFQVR